MIIPVKCFTCGNVLADKYRFYLAEVRKKKLANGLNVDKVVYLSIEKKDKTPSKPALKSWVTLCSELDDKDSSLLFSEMPR